MRSSVWFSLAVLMCAATAVHAASFNANGTVFLHNNDWNGTPACEAGTPPPSCEGANVSVPGGDYFDAWQFSMYAAFPPDSTPRLRGIVFAQFHSGTFEFGVTPWGECSQGGLELPDAGFPTTSGTGNSVVWGNTQTGHMTLVGWFTGYQYAGQTGIMALGPEQNQGGQFATDEQPPQLDEIAGYGSIGFGVSGATACPSALITGACCLPDGSCTLVTETTCGNQGGTWQGEDTACEPNPCPAPLGACCFPNGTCEMTVEEGCPFWQGMGTTCDPNPCPEPMGACCFPDGACEETVEADCFGTWILFGFCDPNPCLEGLGACCYQDGSCAVLAEVDCDGEWMMGQACDPNPCVQPVLRACCFDDQTCQLLSNADCDDAGGMWLADVGACDPNPCGLPLGACCLPNGGCYLAAEEDCEAAWQGPDTVCEPNPCPQPTGACCFEDGECVVLTVMECGDAGGAYVGDDIPCDPYPCASPIETSTWGQIKSRFR